MWLRRLEADRLRNLKAVELRPAAGLTVIHGRNGQGKTSLLEAVYLLATGRSFRTRRLEEAISWGGGPIRVQGEVEARWGRNRLTVMADKSARHLLVQGAEKDLESYLGRLDLVDLTAGRMQVLKGGPEERRRFLDRGVVGLTPAYLRNLGDYRRVLTQRNALLRQIGPRSSGGGQLEAWDERLVVTAGAVHARRREYALVLGGELGAIGRALLPEGAELTLHYRPSPAEARGERPGRFAEVLAASLERRKSRDLGLGFTSAGPHRDDMVVELNGVDLRKYGSAGQLRAAMIALKLAKLSLLRRDRGESPLFLMDDFDTDLDEVRAGRLAAFLHEGGFQALVATSKDSLAGQLGLPCGQIRMDDGVAKAIG